MYGHGAKLYKLATKIRRFTMSTLISVIKYGIIFAFTFALWMIITMYAINAIGEIVAPMNNVGAGMVYGMLSLTCFPAISMILYFVVVVKFLDKTEKKKPKRLNRDLIARARNDSQISKVEDKDIE
jgi:cation transport ATPase